MHQRDGEVTQPSRVNQLNRCRTAEPVGATPATSSLPPVITAVETMMRLMNREWPIVNFFGYVDPFLPGEI